METKKGSLSIVTADWLVNKRVLDASDQEIGSVTDVLIDTTYGRIAAVVVVGASNLFGETGKIVALPWSLLKVTEGALKVEVDTSQIVESPGCERRAWDGIDKEQWLDRVYEYFHAERYWPAAPEGPGAEFDAPPGV